MYFFYLFYLQAGRNACEDHEVIMMLQTMFGSNTSEWNEIMEEAKINNCPVINDTTLNSKHSLDEPSYVGRNMYSFLTPFVILVGVGGHGVSLIIFTSPTLRRLSASLYLTAISVCDILVLLTYVMLDWFKKGLPHWPGEAHIPIIDEPGFCETFLFFSYTFRFISVWLIVVFTIERFIAVCRPLHRRLICTKSFSRKIIAGVALTALVVCLYKPLLSGVHLAGPGQEKICGRNPNHSHLSFILDSIYALLITAVPFLIISLFNFIILKKLLSRDILERQGRRSVMFRGNMLRLEFTFILLAISSCFVCLNMPYFIIWCRQVLLTDSYPATGSNATETINFPGSNLESNNHLYLTKTIFYFNYCVNFFLYCLTGRQYREQIRCLFTRKRSKCGSQRLHSFSTQHSTIPNHPTLVVHHGGNGMLREKLIVSSRTTNTEL